MKILGPKLSPEALQGLGWIHVKMADDQITGSFSDGDVFQHLTPSRLSCQPSVFRYIFNNILSLTPVVPSMCFSNWIGSSSWLLIVCKGGRGGGCSCYQGAGECGCSSEGGGRCFCRRYMQTFFFSSGRNCDEILDFYVEWGVLSMSAQEIGHSKKKRIKQIEE